ncbi:MAG: hypothetical protein AMJ92_01745 [candidate division Zixibacteria bacterium SM23_81]|nr:MAG: hypothetical protein AMJ92_01745 [candidate division Zixibacteria bacterium SM23_81]
MESIYVREIIEATEGQLFTAGLELDIDRFKAKGVSTDSRTILPGEIFIALMGERFDGHKFVAQALKKGASVALVSSEWANRHANEEALPRPLIAVPDTLKALQELAGCYRRKFSVTLIGITGTNGKTTTKDMVAEVLSAGFRTMKTEGNFNNHIGVPLTLFRLSSKDHMAVVEMGMSGPGEIRRSAEIALPQHGLITNIGPAHLQQLKSLEAITKAKFELLEMLPQEGRAFLNADDERLMAQKVIPPSQVVTFGMKQGADYRVTETGVDQELQQHFQVEGLGEFQIPTLGQHNVSNALAAIAVGMELDMPVSSVREALCRFSPSPMRMERIKLGEIIILNDAYNANPASMRAAIQVLVGLKSGGRKIAVLGDMLELGHQAPHAHLELGQFVAASSIDRLIAVGKLAESIAQGALQEGFDSQMIDLCLDAGQAARRLKGILQPGDVVLLKASRAMSLEEILPPLCSPSSKG